jgi:uridine kinase
VTKRLVIGICGGTGSGKTTITERIISALSPESVLVLQQDHYYKDFPHLSLEQRARGNFDHPDSFDTPFSSSMFGNSGRGKPSIVPSTILRNTSELPAPSN